MIHLPDLIRDLGLILMAAAAVTLLFKRMGQPVVLGYLIAGMLVGPHFTFAPSVKDVENVRIWAEIGVIFMLFSLGLEFSFKKLAEVGKSASITAGFEILAMLGVGFVAGRALGWSIMDSLFMGGILSISSTTIIVRAFEELGLKGKGFVTLVFGVLIVEDLIAILLLVLLSSVAATQTLSGPDLAFASVRLGFFLVLWFLLGIYILPIALRRFRTLLSGETMLIVALGLCLMMVIVASQAGFSPALGAFVMGSILAETPKARQIEHLVLPVKDLFSAIFFVSVGMLIDPKVLSEHFGVIVLLTVLTIGGKFVSSALGALVSGRSLKVSVQAGMSLAQIGEFSFIIATLGTTLKVTSDFLYPIAVAVSGITTFTTPYLIRYSGGLYSWLDQRLPERLKRSLERYEGALSTASGGSLAAQMWQEHGVKCTLNSVLVVAITLATVKLLDGRLPSDWISCAIALLLSSPFLGAVFTGGAAPRPGDRLAIGAFVARFMVGAGLVLFMVGQFTPILSWMGVVAIAVASVGIAYVSRLTAPFYRQLESRFLSNLTGTHPSEETGRAPPPELAPWNGTLAEFVVTANSPLVAKSLLEAGLKERFGLTVAMIERGETRILAPKRDDLVLPGDRLFLIGTDEQLALAREVIERPSAELAPVSPAFGLSLLVLQEHHDFIGRPIRECGLRQKVDGLIVGVERGSQRWLSPDSSMVLQAGDRVWIVGDRARIRAL